jgi:lipopolysaccharide export LptBFGC system permease protein LptF
MSVKSLYKVLPLEPLMNTSSKIVIGVVAALALVLTLAIVASASFVAPASAQGNMSTAGKIMVGKAANMTNATGGGMAGNMTK